VRVFENTADIMGSEKTVLIVDDDIDFQLMIRSMLKLSGFGVKSLIEGQLTSTIDSANGCDIILLDIGLPGVSGVDIAKGLKSLPQTAKIPIILVSAHHDSERLFLESKANALFKKPFSLRLVLDKVNELLELNVVSAQDSNLSARLSHNHLAATGRSIQKMI
jgi:DNA-binding response OmpR family regulator